jgi:hypothetical protein
MTDKTAGTLTSADIEAARTDPRGECTCTFTPVGPDRYVRPVTDEHCPVHMDGTVYPNREHRNADRAARRRALSRLDLIETEVKMLRRRIGQGQAGGEDTATILTHVRDLTEFLAILGALSEVRDWHAADQADAPARAERAYQRWLAVEADDAIVGVAQAGSEEVKDAFMDAFTAGAVGAPWLDAKEGS